MRVAAFTDCEATGRFVIVDEYDPVGEDRQRVTFEACETSEAPQAIDGRDEFECSQWCDILSPVNAQTLARYASDFFSGRAAVTKNRYGAGAVYYIGTVLDDAANQALLSQLAERCKIDCMPNLPEGVETAVRSAGTRRVRFVLNLTKEHKRVALECRERVSALSGKRVIGESIELAPGGVEVLVD